MEKYKTAPFIVIKPYKDTGLIIEDFYFHKSFLFDLSYFQLLDFTRTARLYEEVSIFAKKIGISKTTLNQIIKSGLILDSKNKVFGIKKLSKKWALYGHEDSLYYHVSTLNYPFINYADKNAVPLDQGLMNYYKQKGNSPSLYKKYTKKCFIPLKKPSVYPKVEVSKVYMDESASKINLSLFDNINCFLFASFGKIREEKYLRTTQYYRTSPSGGGKHPTESYLCLFRKVGILKPGIYHYNVKVHGLNIIKLGAFQKFFLDANYTAFGTTMNGRTLSFGIIYTSFTERAMWRYRDIRSTRAIFADVGHIAQISRSTGRALNFSSLSEYNFDEEKLRELLEVQYKETVLYTQAFYI